MRTIKFRAWDKIDKVWLESYLAMLSGGKVFAYGLEDNDDYTGRVKINMFTGLKDKNGLQEVYEGDIIDATGNIITNIHEKTHTEKSDFIIQGFGTKDWIATYQGAVARGCKDSE